MAQVETWKRDASGALTEEVEELDEAKSLTMVTKTVQAIHKHGDVVIVGRGGQVILKDQPDVLHVRIEAPLTERYKRIHAQTTFSLAGAKDLAIKRDQAAADYLKRYYAVNWADSGLYDLVINTDKIGIEGAAQLITNAVSYMAPIQSPNKNRPPAVK